MLSHLKSDRCSFIFTTILVHAITSTISTKNLLLYLSQFSPFLLFNKIILKIPTNTPFLHTSSIFHLPIFVYNHLNNLHTNFFSLPQQFIQFKSRQGARKFGSLVRTNTVLISPSFLKV